MQSLTHAKISIKSINSEIYARLLVTVLCSFSMHTFADQFHYNNFLLGPVAQGMGGAGVAKSDNPAGVYYNPGGTAFAEGSSFSGSSSAFYIRSTLYKQVFGDKSLRENSRGAASTFLGGLSRLGTKYPASGLTLGFSLAVPDTKLSDESSSLAELESSKIVRYSRSQTSRENALVALASLAGNFRNIFGLGLSAGYFEVDELFAAEQETLQGPYRFPQFTKLDVYDYSILNSRRLLRMSGMVIGGGLRWQIWNELSFGASMVLRLPLKQESQTKVRKVSAWVDTSLSPVVSATGDQGKEFDGKIKNEYLEQNTWHNRETLPVFLGVGVHWSPTRFYSFAFDLQSYTSRKTNAAPFKKNSVSNFHVGHELKIAKVLVTRSGLFTNFDATPTRNVQASASRGEYIDYVGASGSVALQFKNSEYGVNFVQQWGKGKAEKVIGKENPVEAKLQVLSLTAVQSLP